MTPDIPVLPKETLMEHSPLSARHAGPLPPLDVSAHDMSRLPGRWALGRGRALALRARKAGALQVARGRVWLTFDNAALDLRVRAGDYFLCAGESLHLVAGQSLVIESFAADAVGEACLSWQPVATAGALSRQWAAVRRGMAFLKVLPHRRGVPG